MGNFWSSFRDCCFRECPPVFHRLVCVLGLRKCHERENRNVDMVIMFANPLSLSEVPGQSRVLCFDDEQQLLREQIHESNREIKFVVSVATPNTLLENIRRGEVI